MSYDVKDKKKLILESAKKVFDKFGYSKASMDDVAKEACLGKGTIYYYYDSKEDIFLEILKQLEECLSLEINNLINSKPNFIEKFKTFLEEPIKYLLKYFPILLEVLSSKSPNFLKKISLFRTSCREKTKIEIKALLKIGVEEKILREDINHDLLSDTLLSWFLFGDNFNWLEYSQDKLDRMQKEFKLFSEIILYGIVKRS